MRLNLFGIEKVIGVSYQTMLIDAKDLKELGLERVKKEQKYNRLKMHRLNNLAYLSLLEKINNKETVEMVDLAGVDFWNIRKSSKKYDRQFCNKKGELDIEKINASLRAWVINDGANQRHDSICKE